MHAPKCHARIVHFIQVIAQRTAEDKAKVLTNERAAAVIQTIASVAAAPYATFKHLLCAACSIHLTDAELNALTPAPSMQKH